MHKNFLIALDKKSVRTYDHNGFLHIERSHITKANVCPYLGKEIPDSEKLGLDPKKIYYLLRAPEELEKAVATLNNIPLLIKHDPVSPDDSKQDITVGSTGTDAVWNDPYIDNSLVVWESEAIAGVEDETQKELSAGYYYRADMTPGNYKEVSYDGVMCDIRFNHVALVSEGRAGNDVVVGDSMYEVNKVLGRDSSALKNSGEVVSKLTRRTMNRKTLLSRKASMAKGALAVCLQPRLAQDAKLDLNSALVGVSDTNWGASKVKVINWFKKLPVRNFKNKVAMDAAIEDVVKLLDSLDGEHLDDDGSAKDTDDPSKADTQLEGVTDPVSEPNTPSSADDSPAEAIRALLEGKISNEDMAKVLQLIGGEAQDSDDDSDDSDGYMAELMKRLKGKNSPDASTASPDASAVPVKDEDLDESNGGAEGQDADPDLAATKANTDGSGMPASPASTGKGTLSNAIINKPVVGSEPQSKGKAAMDKVLEKVKNDAVTATMKRMRAIVEAEETVKPLIGKVMAQDSAEAVYRLALDHAGIDLEGVHPSAFKTMVSMLLARQEGSQQRKQVKLAHDGKTIAGFKERFPTAGRVRIL